MRARAWHGFKENLDMLLGKTQPSGFFAIPQSTDAAGGLERFVCEKSGYLVWSPSCQISDVDPYDKSILPFLRSEKPIVCTDRMPLTSVTSLARGHVLRVHEAVELQYLRPGYTLKCCYSNVTRFTTPPGVPYTADADNYYNISSCKEFKKEVKLRPQEEFILVRCNRQKNAHSKIKTEVYVHMHGIVPIKPSVAEKIRERKSPNDDARFNVLMVLYDSISRLNLLRTMPETVAFLKRASYVDLQGFNIVEKSSFPNVMAFLTGMYLNQLKKVCWPSPKTKLDNCPFLWNEFHNHNYVTVYAEDLPELQTFNVHMTGFVTQPTDYYLRPYMLAAEKKLTFKVRNERPVCLGPMSTTGHLLTYALRFVETFKNSFYFANIWENNFSHDDLNTPRAMDVKTVEFFHKLGDTGTYNNTIVLFFSDHGMRFGPMSKTYMGWWEESLPFFYIRLPDSFKKKYPEAYQNLQTNRNRLTSPFDLYVTLKDVLARGMNSTAPNGNVSLACPKCKSLFSEDFGDRSCGDAGIPPAFCTCTIYADLPVNDVNVQNAAKSQ